MTTRTFTFTNERDAKRFVWAQGGPIDIDVTRPHRGEWIVTVTAR